MAIHPRGELGTVNGIGRAEPLAAPGESQNDSTGDYLAVKRISGGRIVAIEVGALFSLKGWNNKAQGNALGRHDVLIHIALKGHNRPV